MMEKKRVFKKVRRQPLVRTARASIHYVKPDPAKPHRVQVFVSPNLRHMHTTAHFKAGQVYSDDFDGMLRNFTSTRTGKNVCRPRHIIARMFLNADSLRANPGEIISHECAHAGMAWARLRNADLSKMEGEEVMCYATGRMTREVNRLCHMLRIFG